MIHTKDHLRLTTHIIKAEDTYWLATRKTTEYHLRKPMNNWGPIQITSLVSQHELLTYMKGAEDQSPI